MSLAEVDASYRDDDGRASRGSAVDRTPPQDLNAEQSVLGAMLMSKDAIADVVEVLRGADFYRPAHELVYDAVLDLYGRGEPADAITVAAELTKRGNIARVGGAPYLHDLLASTSIAANAGYYAEIVREKAILRRLADASIRIGQMSYAAEGDVNDIVDRAQAEVYSVTDQRTSEDYKALSELMQPTMDEIEAIGSRGGQLAGVPTGFADLDDLTNGMHPGQMIIVAARPGMGKALALDTPLPTPTGWTTMGEVQVGDLLIGADGRPTRVVAATEVMRDRECFEITFSDGSRVIADGQHEWPVTGRAARRAALERRPVSYHYDRAAIRRVELLAIAARHEPESYRSFAALLAEVGEEVRHALHTVSRRIGAAVRVGASTSSRPGPTVVYPRARMLSALAVRVVRPIGSANVHEHAESVTTVELYRRLRVGDGRCNWAVANAAPIQEPDAELPLPAYLLGAWLGDGESAEDSVRAKLRAIGVLGNKHIPGSYLRASEQQRRDLLAGLLDTNGWVQNAGTVQIAPTDRRLATDVYELIVSLGYRCTWRERTVVGRTPQSSTAFLLTFVSSEDVFRLKRKRDHHRSVRPASAAHSQSRYVTEVRPAGRVPVRCVQVDNDDHLYLATRSMIPTHNSTIGLDLARSASIKSGLTSAIFSLEMSQIEIVMRLLSAEASIPLNHIRNGKMNDDDWQRMAKKMGEVAEAPLFIDDSPNLTMMEIRAKARRLRQRHDLKLIVIDYLQLLTSGKKVESRQVEVSEFSRQLKLLAKELELPVVALAQLNRGPETRGGDKKPMLSDLRESGCLTAATRILRADNGAEVTLGELLSSGARDVPVWSLDEHLRLVPRTMTHAFPSGVKEVFRLRLTSGREIEATANHPFLTYQGWQPLGELSPGTRLGVPRTAPTPLDPAPHDTDEIKLLAHLLGDGSFVRHQPIRYASIDQQNLNEVARAAKRRFRITAVRDDYPAARVTTLRLAAPYRLTHGCRNPIAAWLDEAGLFGLRSHEKFVPDWVFNLPTPQVRIFIEHLWATDGSVRWDSRSGQGRIYYASTSRRLVDDLARLLLRCGILARIKTVHKPGYRDCYHLIIKGVEQQLRFCTEIGVYGARALRVAEVHEKLQGIKANTNVDTIPSEVWLKVRQELSAQTMTHREFATAMGTSFCGSTMWKHAPSRQRLGRVAEVLHSRELHLEASNDVFWDEIASVESLGMQPVYDATVAGTHNFVANGISVHNSLEQDADMVILLNRPDIYDKESERAGEADFDVAKHRNGPTKTITVAFQGHYSRFIDMHQ